MNPCATAAAPPSVGEALFERLSAAGHRHDQLEPYLREVVDAIAAVTGFRWVGCRVTRPAVRLPAAPGDRDRPATPAPFARPAEGDLVVGELPRPSSLGAPSGSRAAVPMSFGGGTVGVLHVADPRDGLAGPPLLAALDAAARIVASTARRIHAEDALAVLEQRLGAQQSAHDAELAERAADLIETNAKLERAVRLKDEFLAGMSHELRTPLNAILGRSEMLRERIYGPLTDKQDVALAKVEEAGRHLLSLIKDILDVSKVGAGRLTVRLEPVGPADLCHASVGLLRQTASAKRVDLDVVLDPAVRCVMADELRLKQILVNLVSNAVKFTPEGGAVTLTLHGDPARNRVVFSVADTGIGVAPEDRERIFQPFVQIDSSLSREYSGTGLGLALVQQLTDLHGGSVALEPNPAGGSIFSVSLPWFAVDNAGFGGAPSEVPPAPLSPIPVKVSARKVLLAEDNASSREMVAQYLAAKGLAVVLAVNGVEAVSLARTERPDAIVMDIQMPIMDGLAAIRRIRSSAGLERTPVVALTALAMTGDEERCRAAGADVYLTKPVSPRALAKVLKDLFALADAE
jgi:signal transduction histidine kinase